VYLGGQGSNSLRVVAAMKSLAFLIRYVATTSILGTDVLSRNLLFSLHSKQAVMFVMEVRRHASHVSRDSMCITPAQQRARETEGPRDTSHPI
jgi:hypothetical protein